MPQRVVVYWSCSLCSAEFDSQDSVTPYTITGRDVAREYDVCAACEEEGGVFPSILAAGIADRKPKPRAGGQAKLKVVTPTPESGLVPCDYCEGAFHPRGISLHLSRAHNVKAKPRPPGQGPFKCPECSFGSYAAQGLAAHRHHVHGVAGQSGRRETMRKGKAK